MTIKILKSSRGFTYLAALVMVVIMGIMLGVVGQSWQMLMKREREEELLFRGTQIRNAIARWNAQRRQQVVTPLRDLNDLLKDPRSMANVRYLRRIYKDPMTDKDWVIIRGDVSKGIIGVASSSEEKPVRQSFQSLLPLADEELGKMYLSFEKKEKYSEWLFVFGQLPPMGTVNLPKSPF